MSSRQREDDILAAFDAGADEFIAKPFDPHELFARLNAAHRRIKSEGARGVRGILALLREASRSSTGELIVRGHDQVGRILLYEGKVAWVHVSGEAPISHLLSELGVSKEDARLVLEECRVSHAPFIDTLVRWGLAAKEKLYEKFRLEFANRLDQLLLLPSATGFFVPGLHRFESGFLYGLEELEPAAAPRSVVMAPISDDEPRRGAEHFRDLVASASNLEGVESAALIEWQTGRAEIEEGQPFCANLVRQQMRLFRADTDEVFEESTLASNAHYHLLRMVSPHLFLYLRIDRAKTPNIALIRLLLTELQRRLA